MSFDQYKKWVMYAQAEPFGKTAAEQSAYAAFRLAVVTSSKKAMKVSPEDFLAPGFRQETRRRTGKVITTEREWNSFANSFSAYLGGAPA
jgi:hypothetical protein